MDKYYVFNFIVKVFYLTKNKEKRIKTTFVKMTHYNPSIASEIAIARMYTNGDIYTVKDITKITITFYDTFKSNDVEPWRISIPDFSEEFNYTIENELYFIP